MGANRSAKAGPSAGVMKSPGGMVGSVNVAGRGMAPQAPPDGAARWSRPLTQQNFVDQPGFNIQQPSMGMPAYNLQPAGIPIGTAAQMPGGMFSGGQGPNPVARPMKPPGMSDQQYMAVCGGMPPPNPDGPTQMFDPSMISMPDTTIRPEPDLPTMTTGVSLDSAGMFGPDISVADPTPRQPVPYEPSTGYIDGQPAQFHHQKLAMEQGPPGPQYQPLSPAAPPLSSGAQNLVDKGVNPMIARLYGGGS